LTASALTVGYTAPALLNVHIASRRKKNNIPTTPLSTLTKYESKQEISSGQPFIWYYTCKNPIPNSCHFHH